MGEAQRNISPGRRRVILGLTGVVGVMVTSCSFGDTNNPAPSSQGTVTTQARTPGVTPTTGPAQGTTLSIYKGHTNWVNDLAWSPDGKWIASRPAGSTYDPNSTKDYSIHVWNVTTGQNHFIYPTSGNKACEY